MSRLKKVYETLVEDFLEKNAGAGGFAAKSDGDLLNTPSPFFSEINAASPLSIHKIKSGNRVDEKALNLIAVHNIDKWMRNDYDVHLYRSERNLLLARVFINKGFRDEGMRLLATNYKMVCKYQHTAYAMLYASELALRFAIAGKRKQYLLFNRAIGAHEIILLSEQKCLRAYYKSIALIGHNWAHSNATLVKVKYLAGMLKAEMNKHPWHVNIICFYRVQIFYFQIAEKYDEVIKTCGKFDQYLRRNKHLSQDGKFAEIAHYLLNACVVQKKYAIGLSYITRYQQYFHKGNANWLLYMEVYFQLLMHAEKYDSALALYSNLTSTSLFKNSTVGRKETWKIYKAYLDFALRDIKAIKHFRPSSFLNSFSAILSDRQGLHFESLIIVFIYRIVKKDREALSGFSVFMQTYIKRNMSRKTNFRNYYFAKLLLLLYKYDFNADKAEAIGKKYHRKLKDTYAVRRKDKRIVEVIPYEKLWMMILKLLREKGTQHFLLKQNA